MNPESQASETSPRPSDPRDFANALERIVRSRVIIAFFMVATTMAVSAAGGLSDKTASLGDDQTQVTTGTSLEKKLAEARANLAAVEALGEAALTNTPAGVPLQDVATRRALLNRLVRLLEQQLSNASELETTKTRRAEVARQAQAWTRFAEPPPYSVLLVDRLREDIQVEQLRIKIGGNETSTIEILIAENRTALNQAEEGIRRLNEQLEGAKEPVIAARLTWQRELERLRSQVAAASVGALDSERQLRQETLAESRIRLGLCQRQVVLAASTSASWIATVAC